MLPFCNWSVTFFSGRVDHFSRSLAAVDLPVADHRGPSDRARDAVLHTVHTDQSVHHLRHGHRGLLRTGDSYVFPVFSYIQRDEKETKRLAEPASHEQTAQVRDENPRSSLPNKIELYAVNERKEY